MLPKIFKSFGYLFLLALLISSCSKRPRSVLNEKKMTEIIIDLYKAESVIQNDRSSYRTNQQKDVLIEAVFEKYNITQKQFDESLGWYTEDVKLLTGIQDSVGTKLQKEYDLSVIKFDSRYTYKLKGFTTVLPEHYTLNFNNPTFSFKIGSMKLKDIDLDGFKFSFSTIGVDTCQHNLEASVYYVYDDTTVVDRRQIETEAHYEFIKPNLSDSLLLGISGYVHLKNPTIHMSTIILNDIRNTDQALMNKMDSMDVSLMQDSLPKL